MTAYLYNKSNLVSTVLLDTSSQVRYDLLIIMSSMKKILLIGFVVVLLIAIPVTVFLVQQQQKIKSGAVAATTISILPAAQDPIHVGDDVTLNVQVNPATATTSNLVSVVQLTITYDSTKIATDGAGFVPNTTTGLPLVAKGPTYGNGTISITLSAGGDATKIIQKTTDIGTVTFKAIATTDAAPTQINFGNDTQVRSIGSTEVFNENVLASANPAILTIIAGTDITPSPTGTLTPTATPTLTPTPTPTGAPTATPTPTQSAAAPVCSSLTADIQSGAAPLSTNLTVTGTSADSTISKVTFNFGDGQSQDITASGGIGTSSVSILQSHSYATAGTFNATATLTDANNAVSSSTNCAVTITTTGSNGTVAENPTAPPIPTATPIPTQSIAQVSPLPPTGPTDLIKIGSIGAIITIIGVALLLAL